MQPPPAPPFGPPPPELPPVPPHLPPLDVLLEMALTHVGEEVVHLEGELESELESELRGRNVTVAKMPALADATPHEEMVIGEVVVALAFLLLFCVPTVLRGLGACFRCARHALSDCLSRPRRREYLQWKDEEAWEVPRRSRTTNGATRSPEALKLPSLAAVRTPRPSVEQQAGKDEEHASLLVDAVNRLHIELGDSAADDSPPMMTSRGQPPPTPTTARPTPSAAIPAPIPRMAPIPTPLRSAEAADSSSAKTPRTSKTPRAPRTHRAPETPTATTSATSTARSANPLDAKAGGRRTQSPPIVQTPYAKSRGSRPYEHPPLYSGDHDFVNDDEAGASTWRGVPHAHRMQINFHLKLSGTSGDTSAMPSSPMLAPPSEIRFILSVEGIEVKMPPPKSVHVHCAAPIAEEALVLPPTPDKLDADLELVPGSDVEPFMMYSCNQVRSSDVVGWDDERGIFDDVQIVVTVPVELNPALAAPATSSFSFRRLGSSNRSGRHSAAHVALPIRLATIPLTDPDAAVNALRAWNADLGAWTPEGSGGGLFGSLFGGGSATAVALPEAEPPPPKVPPIVPILPMVPSLPTLNAPSSTIVDEEPSLAKSIAQIRMDSARRRQAERWAQMRLDSARWMNDAEERSQSPAQSALSQRSARMTPPVHTPGKSPSRSANGGPGRSTCRSSAPNSATRPGSAARSTPAASPKPRAVERRGWDSIAVRL